MLFSSSFLFHSSYPVSPSLCHHHICLVLCSPFFIHLEQNTSFSPLPCFSPTPLAIDCLDNGRCFFVLVCQHAAGVRCAAVPEQRLGLVILVSDSVFAVWRLWPVYSACRHRFQFSEPFFIGRWEVFEAINKIKWSLRKWLTVLVPSKVYSHLWFNVWYLMWNTKCLLFVLIFFIKKLTHYNYA